MKNRILIAILPILILFSCTGRQLVSDGSDSIKLCSAVEWTHIVSDSLNNAPANIHILDVDLKKLNGQVDIAWLKDTLMRTSDLAAEKHAIAAVNGSFFDLRQGGAVVYLQKNGETIADNYDNSPFCCSGAYTMDYDGNIDIIPIPDTGWAYSSLYKDMMAGGPILIDENKICEKDSIRFNLTRHPRTAIGITQHDHFLMVTVDGRHSQAAGMTIHELTDFMKELGCKDALNLDGGGSTTMYINGKSETGVVNCPSDNKRFDNEGERSVSNILFLRR